MAYSRLVIFLGTLILAACGADKQEKVIDKQPDLSELDQRLSYMVGNNLARQFERDDVKLDIDALLLGIEDTQSSKESRLSQEEIQDTVAIMQERNQKRQENLRAEQEKIQAEAAVKNKKESEEYLAANSAKEDVVTTESGLQYKKLISGDGPSPTAEDTVSVHYKGNLVDGTEFDSSYARGEPAVFPVSGVIPGWVEALQLMRVGDKWELVIPSDLAYGSDGAGSVIGPNAALVFQVELLDIVKPESDSDSKSE